MCHSTVCACVYRWSTQPFIRCQNGGKEMHGGFLCALLHFYTFISMLTARPNREICTILLGGATTLNALRQFICVHGEEKKPNQIPYMHMWDSDECHIGDRYRSFQCRCCRRHRCYCRHFTRMLRFMFAQEVSNKQKVKQSFYATYAKRTHIQWPKVSQTKSKTHWNFWWNCKC